MMITPLSGCLGNLAAEQRAIKTPQGRILHALSSVTGLALIVIACVGAAGVLPGSTMGWLTIGLGGGTFALSLAVGKLKDRKITLLIGALVALIPIVVGSLGVTGILSGVQVGWGVLAPALAVISIACCYGCYLSAKIFRDVTRQHNLASEI